MNTYNKGKYLLRRAFEKDAILPHSILMREKAAFSDAVGHSMVDDLKEYAESVYTDGEFAEKRHATAMPLRLQKNPSCTGRSSNPSIPARPT